MIADCVYCMVFVVCLVCSLVIGFVVYSWNKSFGWVYLNCYFCWALTSRTIVRISLFGLFWVLVCCCRLELLWLLFHV